MPARYGDQAGSIGPHVSRWLPVGLLLVATLAVLLVPGLGHGFTGDSSQLKQSTRFALTALVLIGTSAAYLLWVAHSAGLGHAWFGLMLGYNSLIVVVKFVLSPSAYQATTKASLGQFLAIGLVVMAFYLLALGILRAVARRAARAGGWSWRLRIVLLAGVAVVATSARFVAVPLVGAPAALYLRHLFSGAGLILPAVLLLMGLLAILAFQAATSARTGLVGLSTTVRAAAALLVAYHGLWVLFMVRTTY